MIFQMPNTSAGAELCFGELRLRIGMDVLLYACETISDQRTPNGDRKAIEVKVHVPFSNAFQENVMQRRHETKSHPVLAVPSAAGWVVSLSYKIISVRLNESVPVRLAVYIYRSERIIRSATLTYVYFFPVI